MGRQSIPTTEELWQQAEDAIEFGAWAVTYGGEPSAAIADNVNRHRARMDEKLNNSVGSSRIDLAGKEVVGAIEELRRDGTDETLRYATEVVGDLIKEARRHGLTER